MWTIYGLFLEGEDKPFYVGCTSSTLGIRLSNHRSAAKRKMHTSPIYIVGAEPRSVICRKLDEAPDIETGHRKEQEWIAHYGRRPEGCLVNKVAGGAGGVDPTPDVRKKMSDTHIGNTYRLGKPRPDAAIRNSKQISAYDHTGKYVATFSSGRAASSALVGISPKTISSVIHGRLRSAKASDGTVYQFRFGSNEIDIEPVSHRDTWATRR